MCISTSIKAISMIYVQYGNLEILEVLVIV
jgi:hypothetical protein